jgi:membrane-associated phospholipid phosphatase
MPIDPDAMHLWHLMTRLGEAQILVPVALLAALVLVRRPGAGPLAAWWMASVCLAVFLTTATKVAFIGWGIGWAEFDFTGISGHAMFATAVYPVLLTTLSGAESPLARRLAALAGFTIALLVGVSRLVLGAHSVSEVLAGWLVGGAASATALAMEIHAPGRVGVVSPVAVALWLVFMPAQAPASRTHTMVTRLALALSGHKTPYTRGAMLRELHRRQHDACVFRAIPDTVPL